MVPDLICSVGIGKLAILAYDHTYPRYRFGFRKKICTKSSIYYIYVYIIYMIFRTCTLLQSTTGPMDPGLGKNRKTHLTNMLNDLQLSNENKKQKKNNGFLIKIVL